MPKVVYFTPNNARVVYMDSPPSKLGLNYVVDPDLSAVKGLPPHQWKLSAGLVLPLSPEELEDRELHILKYGIINDLNMAAPAKTYRMPAKLKYALCFLAGALISYLLRSL